MTHQVLRVERLKCIHLHKVAMAVHENGKNAAKKTSMPLVVDNEVLEKLPGVFAGNTYRGKQISICSSNK